MAQQARPHWYTHIEYEPPEVEQLGGTAPGMRPRSTRPTEESSFPGVEQAVEQQHDERPPSRSGRTRRSARSRPPGEDEHRFDVEDDEEQTRTRSTGSGSATSRCPPGSTPLWSAMSLWGVGAGWDAPSRGDAEQQPAERNRGGREPHHGQVSCGRSSATSTAAAATPSCSASAPRCCAPRCGRSSRSTGSTCRRRAPRCSTLALVGGGGLGLRILWFLPEYLGSGDFLRAADRARQPNPDSRRVRRAPVHRGLQPQRLGAQPPVYVGGVLAVVVAIAAKTHGLYLAMAAIGTVLMVAVAGDDPGGVRRQPALRRAAGRARMRARRRRLGLARPLDRPGSAPIAAAVLASSSSPRPRRT